MRGAVESRRRLLHRRVLTYWWEHPAAKDTTEGIRHWWLGDLDEVLQADLQAVLEDLVERGWVTVRGEEQVFALVPSAITAIGQFLRSEEE